MKTANTIFAWPCIIGVLCMGCYSSMVLEPTGVDRGKLWLGKIDYVVMKNELKYTFDIPPAIVKDTIVGQAKYRVSEGIARKQVTLPLSDVKYVHVSEFQPMNTTFLVLGLIAGGLVIAIAANSD
jgi:hypothetical protein